MSRAATGGCGGGACQCSGGGEARPLACVNGIALHEAGEAPDADELRERAWGELLRQEAVRRGLLPRHHDLTALALSAGDEEVLQGMLALDVPDASPSEAECRRYFDASRARFTEGRRARVRHILFAVTDGVDVEALARRAEEALRELARPDAPPGRFAALARELSNCPSGAEGGELGWIAPRDCAEEFGAGIFFAQGGVLAPGLIPRLVASRFGFHVVEVIEAQAGREPAFDEVRERVAAELRQRSRATALHQYIRVLAGRAVIEGVDLEAAETPLVQ